MTAASDRDVVGTKVSIWGVLSDTAAVKDKDEVIQTYVAALYPIYPFHLPTCVDDRGTPGMHRGQQVIARRSELDMDGGSRSRQLGRLQASKYGDGCEDAMVAASRLNVSATAGASERARTAQVALPCVNERAELCFPGLALVARQPSYACRSLERWRSRHGRVSAGEVDVEEESSWRTRRRQGGPRTRRVLAGRGNHSGKVKRGLQGRGRAQGDAGEAAVVRRAAASNAGGVVVEESVLEEERVVESSSCQHARPAYSSIEASVAGARASTPEASPTTPAGGVSGVAACGRGGAESAERPQRACCEMEISSKLATDDVRKERRRGEPRQWRRGVRVRAFRGTGRRAASPGVSAPVPEKLTTAPATAIAMVSIRWLPRFSVDARVSPWAVELGGHAKKGERAHFKLSYGTCHPGVFMVGHWQWRYNGAKRWLVFGMAGLSSPSVIGTPQQLCLPPGITAQNRPACETSAVSGGCAPTWEATAGGRANV
ncbi:hypothetical protein BJ912DRAFT_1121502 [Pholiota molesta]|nr:hypothetical protein BJ912DRAFT_1121502 [Pholiota molesta]